MLGVSNTFTNAQINSLVNKIKAGHCVPFLGAGANVCSDNPSYSDLPIGRELAAEFFRELGEEKNKLAYLKALIDGLELDAPKIAQLLQANGMDATKLAGLDECQKLARLLAWLGFDHRNENNLAYLSLRYEMDVGRPDLNRFLKTKIPDENHVPSPLLKALARLPFKLIITTNYDCLMERALEEEGKVEGQDFIIVEQTPKGLKDKKINSKIAGFSGVTLYKIHGSFIRQLPTPFADPAPSGLILTEEDYIQFLTLLTQELKVSANTINFRIKESTLLFLGYGLQDWDFRVLYKSLIEGLQDNERETSYAVQKNPDPVWVNYWNKKQVQIKDMDLYAFAMQLEQWYNNTQP